jgi:hypothetical protein
VGTRLLQLGPPHFLGVFSKACPPLASASLNKPPLLCSSHTMTPLLHHILIGLLSLLLSVSAYIPAVPTNDTGLAIQGGLNVTDISRVILQWYSVAG